MPGQERFFIVRADLLPEVVQKTARAKEMLSRGEVSTINEAIQMVGISRSSFYKYKDGIFSLEKAVRGLVISLVLRLEHRSGVLSRVLQTIAYAQGNVVTINQGVPIHGMAEVGIEVDTNQMNTSMEEMLATLRELPGVKSVEIAP